MSRNFVDLKEEDIPYHQFIKEMKAFKESNPIQPVRSRNDIFSISHTISKPATKMTSQELEMLKKGDGPILELKKEESTTILIPVANTALPVSKSVYSSKPKPVNTSFLTVDVPDQITHPSDQDGVSLSFLPIAKNYLGQGRYSKVFKASYSVEGGGFRPCAVKRLHGFPEAQSLGLSESVVLNTLKGCRNIIRLIDVKDEADVNSKDVKASRLSATFLKTPLSDPSPRLLLVLEYLPTGNLWDWMCQNKSKISKKLWLKWAREIAFGICDIHSKGIVHHDIKPHNILLTDLLDIRIADFGNACFVPEAEPLTVDFAQSPVQTNIKPGNPEAYNSQSLTDGLGRGTLAYTAPEMLREGASYSFAVDVYSTGVTLYTLISGVEPFGLARTQSMIYHGIQRGFFESGLQGMNAGGDPLDMTWKFLSGEAVPFEWIKIILNTVNRDPDSRPTAMQLASLFDNL